MMVYRASNFSSLRIFTYQFWCELLRLCTNRNYFILEKGRRCTFIPDSTRALLEFMPGTCISLKYTVF
jgi:hypothetical protein